MFCPSQRKNYIITGLDRNFFNAPCKRVTSSLQKRKHCKSWYPYNKDNISFCCLIEISAPGCIHHFGILSALIASYYQKINSYTIWVHSLYLWISYRRLKDAATIRQPFGLCCSTRFRENSSNNSYSKQNS